MGETPVLKGRRLDSIRLDANDRTYFTAEGYLVDHPILTTTGIFEYKQDDGSIRRELRLPEYVFEEESLKSYKGKPIIITHDAGSVDKDNVEEEQIGTILSEGYKDGDNVRAEIIIHDTNTMKASGLKELSVGYSLDTIEDPGEWNGQHYDAIQTNIRVNHLALVFKARAGNKARLNIDGSSEPTLKGGKAMTKNEKGFEFAADSGLTPDELGEAIKLFKAKKAGEKAEEPKQPEKEAEEVPNADGEKKDEAEVKEPAKPAPAPATGKTPKDIVDAVKANRDSRGKCDSLDSATGIITRQDEDIDKLIAVIETLMEKEAKEEAMDGKDSPVKDGADCDVLVKKDGAEDESKSLNMDGADIDAVIRERLSVCRMGDKLNLDGLEAMPLMEAKKAVIGKVSPGMRLDGKSKAYINAAYDMAVSEAMKPKDVNYQRMQIVMGGTMRADSAAPKSVTSAAEARQRMIDREGGNQ